MGRFIRRSGWASSSLAALAVLLASDAFAAEGMNAQAKFCQDFFHEVIMGGQLDKASHYLTDDFQEHSQVLQASGLSEFIEKVKAMRVQLARGAATARSQPTPTVLTSGDLVVFVTEQPMRDDPRNPGQKLPAGNHFDVYRLRDGKIAAHWD